MRRPSPPRQEKRPSGNIGAVRRSRCCGTVSRMCRRPQIDASPEATARIETILGGFGRGALRATAAGGTRIVHLNDGEGYASRSRVLRRLGARVDDWPLPPAGLFVVEERTIYLRSLSPMTVAHEFAHALDCALGGGVYLSGIDPRVREAFGAAQRFVTPYAACGLDEYFAECARAWVGANDPHSPWPRATRARLRAVDPAMATILEGIFRQYLAA